MIFKNKKVFSYGSANKNNYRPFSNLGRAQSKNINVSRLVL